MRRALVLLALLLAACGPRASAPPSRVPPAEPVIATRSLPSDPSASVAFGSSLAGRDDLQAYFVAVIDAWAQSYPMPGCTYSVVRYPTVSPAGVGATSWRDLDAWPADMHLTWERNVVEDPSWEIPREYYRVDDPASLGGSGPTMLPADGLAPGDPRLEDEAARREAALARVAALSPPPP